MTEEPETLEESLTKKPANLDELKPCFGKIIRLDDLTETKPVVYTGDNHDYYFFVHQLPGSKEIGEYIVHGESLIFKEGVIQVKPVANFTYNTFGEHILQYKNYKELLENMGLWKD
jgi:predicted MPP superfamily phosphohydrolase